MPTKLLIDSEMCFFVVWFAGLGSQPAKHFEFRQTLICDNLFNKLIDNKLSSILFTQILTHQTLDWT